MAGDWLKTIISLKKAKKNKPNQPKGSSATAKSNGFKGVSLQELSNGTSNPGLNGRSIEDIAAIRIQTAFRGYKARKYLRRLKGVVRFKVLSERHTVKQQASTALSYIHSWSKMQSQIRGRRQCMVSEFRLRQKNLENQLKLEAKLNELEAEWCGGSETMEEVLSRIQHREEAAVKRERAMAYAFSHQWRATSSPNQGKTAFDLGKEEWGWSWTERWIAARPWESRVPGQSMSPKKIQSRPVSKVVKQKSPPAIKLVSVKSAMTNGKAAVKVKDTSDTTAQKANSHAICLFPSITEEIAIKQQQIVN